MNVDAFPSEPENGFDEPVLKDMGRVAEAEIHAPRQFDIEAVFLSFCEDAPGFVHPHARNVAIAVVLVDRHNGRRRIDQDPSPPDSLPQEPVIPSHPPNGKWRQANQETFRKNKVIDTARGVQDSVPACPGSQGVRYTALKIEFFGDIQVPALTSHEEWAVKRGPDPHGFHEITEEKDIRVHIADQVVCREGLGLFEKVADKGRAEGAAHGISPVPGPDFLASLPSAGLIPENQDLDLRNQVRPGAEGVHLDQAVMPPERFGCGEKCQHGIKDNAGREEREGGKKAGALKSPRLLLLNRFRN
jgi:hypothetical protein